jgi:hypothetical protein
VLRFSDSKCASVGSTGEWLRGVGYRRNCRHQTRLVCSCYHPKTQKHGAPTHRDLELRHGSGAKSAESIGSQARHRSGSGSKKSVDDLSSQGLSGLWFGANPNKGLAVFCNKGFRLRAVAKPFGKWVVPVRVHGARVDFNLLAVWCVSGRDEACGQLPRSGSRMSRGTRWLVRHESSCSGWRFQQ